MVVVGTVVALVVVLLVIAQRHDSAPVKTVAAPTTVSSSTSTTAPTVPTAPPTTIPDGNSFVATATVPSVAVFDDPSAPAPARTYENPWLVNGNAKAAVPLVFLVETQRSDGWVQVQLPTRPNGGTGWVHTSDLSLARVEYHITVSKHDHQLTLFRGHDVVLTDRVAVGTLATPTPEGVFFIRALLKAPDPNTVYGPFAYGLSGYSETLDQFDGADAEIGIHGNNDASVLGHDITHGCIRMSNDGITKLAALLPLGTPVEIDS
jgi:lipoprotein-anchoring transpeptidase ErfK/SrfK